MAKEAQSFIDEVKPEKEEKILEEAKENLEKEKTMKLSIKEGAAASVMGGVGESYITPFALVLNANNAQIGLLGSLSGFLGPLSQIGGSRLMEKFSRKKIFVAGVALQAFMWIPMLMLGILMNKNILTSALPYFLIIFYSLYAILGSIGGPAWFSLLGDIVPEKIRGKYFGKRNAVSGTVALLTTLGAAFLLDYFKTKGILLICFSVLFAIASIARFISAGLLKKHYEPKLKLNEGYYFSFFQFLKKAPKNNFGKFTIFTFFFYFAVQIAGPFFTVYMLKHLGFDYLIFTLVTLAQSLVSLLTFRLWGKFSDKYGNLTTLKICSLIIPFIPIAWIFSPSPIYLILVPQLISGLAWAGFNLSASNFIYDTVTPTRRGICVAYFNLMNGIGTFIGGIIGGFIAYSINIKFMDILLFTFVISGVLRLVIAVIFLPMLKEVKIVRKFEMSHIRPLHIFKGIFFEIINDVMFKKRKSKNLNKKN